MIKTHRGITLVWVFCLFSILLTAQEDPILFKVEDTPVHVSEFNYIYTKTNSTKADYSEKSLREYLDLYTNFKLKVHKAKELKLDTIPILKQELEGYRKQLSSSYLTDKQVKERLIKEAYNRKKEDVNVSHILKRFSTRLPTPKDTLLIYQKISEIQSKLKKGEKFEALAKLSEDAYTKDNGGEMGYINALLPSGFYDFETAAYNTPIGKHSGIIRTPMGYHILKVNSKRPAMGTVEVAHVLIRNKGKAAGEAKQKIEAAYAELKKGALFGDVVDNYSEDKKTKANAGRIGFWKTNSTEAILTKTAFDLKSDGDISEPIESSIGWHIIRRISKPEFKTFEIERAKLQAQVEKDARLEMANNALLSRLKKENNFTIQQATLDRFIKSLDKTFLSFKWKAPAPSNEKLFSIADNVFTLGDYSDYLAQNKRERGRLGRRGDIANVVNIMLEKYVNDKVIAYEKTQLEKKYPDFRALMREYEEGILLFEVTKQNVWDKASQDTSGLISFYEKNKTNYKYKSRAKATKYTLQSQSEKLLAKVRKYAKKKSPTSVLSKINKAGKLLKFDEEEIEEGKINALKGSNWKKGTLSKNEINDDNSVTFYKIESTLPSRQKTLKEARGYVVADYQDKLEKAWVKSLRDTYKVDINEEVLKSLIKK